MEHPYGLFSIAPPLVAIFLAIVTRRPIVSLIAGLFFGALVTTGGDPLAATADLLEIHLWPTLIDPGKMRVFAFTLLMAGMIGVISRSGGMQGLIQLIAPLAKTRRGGQLTTWFAGLVVFFDDYANTILLGSTLRPLTDRLKISREKLAYLVDSTAAPVASLALLSTWIAVEVDYIGEGIGKVDEGSGLKPMELFIASIPYRFYALMALVMVPLIAFSGRDFGPMLRKERESLGTAPGKLDAQPMEDDASEEDANATFDPSKARWYNAAAPIAMTLAVVMWLLYITGKQSLGDVESPKLREILGAADSSLALQYGSLAGLILAGSLAIFQKLLDGPGVIAATGKGMKVVLPAIAILWCASALSRMTGSKSVDGVKSESSESYEFQDHRLYAGRYLKNVVIPSEEDLETNKNPRIVKMMPTIVFVLAAVLAFSTGTSFGTMGLLMPTAISVTYQLLEATGGGAVDPNHPILLGCVASVLSGAVFGDHCSPISDTTILSSQACRCDHISHVVTQMPYAVVVGFVSIGLGTIPLGFGVSLAILLPIQIAALVAIVMLFGKKVAE